MKRFLIFVLSIILVFCLTACSKAEINGETGESEIISPEEDAEMEGTAVNIMCGEYILEMELADTVAAKGFEAKLTSGNISVQMRGYGDFEMVGGLGFSLARNDVYVKAVTGDVMLYSGDQIVIFYGSNSWSYTRIGRIKKATREGLLDFFGTTGEVTIVFSKGTK